MCCLYHIKPHNNNKWTNEENINILHLEITENWIKKLTKKIYYTDIPYWYTNLQFSDCHNGQNNDFVTVLQCKNAKIAQTKRMIFSSFGLVL